MNSALCGRCLAVEVQLALRTVLLWSRARPLEEKRHTRGGKLEDEDEEAGETRVAWMEWLLRRITSTMDSARRVG